MYTLDFSAEQQDDLVTLLLTDTSSGGTDGNITYRRIYLYKLDGTTLVPDGTTTDYIDWPLVNPSGIGDTKEISVLSRDYSLSIFVVTNSSSPISGATYSKTEVFTAVKNTKAAAYEILQGVPSQQAILNDPDFRQNLFLLHGEIENAELAQENENQFAAQSALDRAYQMITNRNIYF